MSATLHLSRRHLFGLGAGGVLSSRMQVKIDPAMVVGTPPDGLVPGHHADAGGISLCVAGPRDSDLAAWARILAPPLSDGLHSTRPMALQYRGGVDGVTAANQFNARAMPDGQSALLFSGSVMLAWLAGEARVRLDPAGLLPLMAVFGSGVLMVNGRLDKHADKPLRLAMGPQPNAALTAMLGLDLLGIPALVVRDRGNLVSPAWPSAANAVFLHGPGAAMRAAPLLQQGFRPVLSTGRDARDQATAAELAAPYFLADLEPDRATRDPLVKAWLALAASTALCAVLVVPRLTPATAVAQWRQGVAASLSDSAVVSLAEDQAVRVAAGEALMSALGPMHEDEAVQRAFRHWLATRLDWQAG